MSTWCLCDRLKGVTQSATHKQICHLQETDLPLCGHRSAVFSEN